MGRHLLIEGSENLLRTESIEDAIRPERPANRAIAVDQYRGRRRGVAAVRGRSRMYDIECAGKTAFCVRDDDQVREIRLGSLGCLKILHRNHNYMDVSLLEFLPVRFE